MNFACLCFFFVKQKTAYEMRISDWSSDVCSSDLTYQDWIVACQARDDAARCVMTQIRTAPRTGQRVLAIELRAAGEETVAGVLVMPFGLALSKGVALRVDDGAGEPASDFSTCLPGGCLVPPIGIALGRERVCQYSETLV